MAKAGVPHFKNDAGVSQISIGVREFMCEGASSPYDHPHVYLDIAEGGEKVCPYCSTLYRYDATLTHDQADPADCIVKTEYA